MFRIPWQGGSKRFQQGIGRDIKEYSYAQDRIFNRCAKPDQALILPH